MKWSNSEKKQFGNMLHQTAEMYGRKLSPKSIGLYIKILDNTISFPLAVKALIEYLGSPENNSSFFPKPGDLKRILLGTQDENTERAWHEVMRAISEIGPYRSIQFRDQIINIIISTDCGGWPNIAGKNDNELKYIGNEFRRLYLYYSRTERYPAVTVKYLPGLTECENRLLGYNDDIDPPVLFGTPGSIAKKITYTGKEKDQKMLI